MTIEDNYREWIQPITRLSYEEALALIGPTNGLKPLKILNKLSGVAFRYPCKKH